MIGFSANVTQLMRHYSGQGTSHDEIKSPCTLHVAYMKRTLKCKKPKLKQSPAVSTGGLAPPTGGWKLR